jgi:hypothetical protein
MGWKEWSYWLKGGIIGLIYFFIIWVFETIIGDNPLFISHTATGWEGILFGIAFFPVFILIDWLANMLPLFIQNGGDKINALIMQIYFLISAFLIGAFIGWIVGKIKKK